VVDGANKGMRLPAGTTLDGRAKLLLSREIEEFILYEVALLDERRFEEWRDLFTDDGFYWAPATLDQDNPQDSVSLFFDDKAVMAARFARLRHPRVHAQTPPSRTSHQVSNFMLEDPPEARGPYVARSRFLMLEYRPSMEQRVFGGHYEHRLIRSGDSFKLNLKKATIINCDAVFYPLAIPF